MTLDKEGDKGVMWYSVPVATIVSLCICPYVCKWTVSKNYNCMGTIYKKWHPFTNPSGLA